MWFPHNCKHKTRNTKCKIAYIKPKAKFFFAQWQTQWLLSRIFRENVCKQFRKCMPWFLQTQLWDFLPEFQVLLRYHCNTTALPSAGYSITLHGTVTTLSSEWCLQGNKYIRSVGFMSYFVSIIPFESFFLSFRLSLLTNNLIKGGYIY